MIYRSHGVEVESFLHPDACCGKSCVDDHFAVAWRHVKKYIEERESDVVTLEDLIDALIYDGGLKNTGVEFIKVDRHQKTFQTNAASMESGVIGKLSSPAEITYGRRSDRTLALTCHACSGCYFTIHVIDGYECIWDGEHVYERAEDKEQLEDDELYYINKHGERTKHTFHGPLSEKVKMNRRAKFRKMQAANSGEFAETARLAEAVMELDKQHVEETTIASSGAGYDHDGVISGDDGDNENGGDEYSEGTCTGSDRNEAQNRNADYVGG